jgi:hypothetical protein
MTKAKGETSEYTTWTTRSLYNELITSPLGNATKRKPKDPIAIVSKSLCTEIVWAVEALLIVNVIGISGSQFPFENFVPLTK